MSLSHFDKEGKAVMVDISGKDKTARLAIACGHVLCHQETVELIEQGDATKGDVLGAARLAGIMAAKKTAGLIPLCHPLLLEKVTIDFTLDVANGRIDIRSTVAVTGKTGAEMEALTAVTVAALTIYDMVKAVDKEMIIGGVALLEKSGGKSGHFVRKSDLAGS